MEMAYDEDADRQLKQLERDPSCARLVQQIYTVLDALEADPGDRSLGTSQFVSPGYGMVRSTPVRFDDWHVIWVLREDGGIVVAFLGTGPPSAG